MTPVLETPSKVKEAIPEEGAAGARGQEPPGTACWVPTDECWGPMLEQSQWRDQERLGEEIEAGRKDKPFQKVGVGQLEREAGSVCSGKHFPSQSLF